jgi:dihydrofolate reductase
MRVIYYTASSLDGYIADPAHSLAWLFAQEHTEPDDPNLRMDTLPGRISALVMGSTTYRWIRDEGAAEDWPYTQPTWVLSHRGQETIDGADLHFTSGEVTDVFREIATVVHENGPDNDGALWIVGGGDLAGQFADAGLLDEVVVSYAPVTLGAGAPLLPRRLQLQLSTVETAGDFISARFLVEGVHPAADWTT